MGSLTDEQAVLWATERYFRECQENGVSMEQPCWARSDMNGRRVTLRNINGMLAAYKLEELMGAMPGTDKYQHTVKSHLLHCVDTLDEAEPDPQLQAMLIEVLATVEKKVPAVLDMEIDASLAFQGGIAGP
jgi:hypothetical protein